MSTQIGSITGTLLDGTPIALDPRPPGEWDHPEDFGINHTCCVCFVAPGEMCVYTDGERAGQEMHLLHTNRTAAGAKRFESGTYPQA